jgi:hypothetical protein
LQVHSGAPIFHHLWQSIGESLSSWYHCKTCVNISIYACLCLSVCYIGTHCGQVSWYLRSSWMMEC